MLLLPRHGLAAGLRLYGDILLSRGIEQFVSDKGTEPVRQALVPFLDRDAVHVANLEGAVGTACTPGRTPCFPIMPAMLDLVDDFDVLSLENNHALDAGPSGVGRTVDALRRKGIIALAGKKASATVETSEGTVAIVSATDVVNAVSDRRHLMAADDPALLAEIRRLRKGATVVAVFVHWGRELIAAPTQRMRELARQYVAAGADVVAGTHPHVPGRTACVDGKPVAWSLGNFLFDQKYDATKEGALLDCDLAGGNLSCRLVGQKTGGGSYLPAAVAGDRFAEENAVLSACTPRLIPTWTGRFGRDRREKRLVQVPVDRNGSMSLLELYDLETGRREFKTPPMPIRKVQPVDLNGDGTKEVMLIQEIYSPLDRETAKRIYLYSFAGSFHALWRGSALSRPLLDATFVAGRRKKPVLVALHREETFLKRNPGTKRRTVMEYRWNGFGFTGSGEREAPPGATAVWERDGTLHFVATTSPGRTPPRP